MRRIRTLLCVLLALCMLLPALPAARAEAPTEDERFAGKSWDEVVEEFLQSWGVDAKNIGIGYYNTVTGEEHYVNADEYRITASMYKVPLNMVFLDRLSKGEMDWDTNISGYTYETALEQTIVHSNNDIARNMVKWELGNGNWQAGRRVIAPYCGLDPENVDWKFQENNYSTPRQMIYCLRLLYENPDRFPRLVETMQRAEPTEYFKRRERRFDIAHKYGFLQDGYHLYLNDCGIAFTDDPILIVLFTDNVTKAYEVMTEFCTLMCDYTQYHTRLRLAEEAAEAERQRQEEERQAALSQQAAEEAEREAERIREEAASATEEPDTNLPEETPTPAPTQPPDEANQTSALRLVRRAEEEGLSRTAIFAGAGVLLCSLIGMIVLAVLGKKYRVRSRWAVLTALLLCLVTLGRITWPAVRQMRDRPEGDPREVVLRFFDALANGDFEAAYACLDGVETLGLELVPEGESNRAVYEAMRDQFSAELYGECSVDGNVAYQQVTCHYFDLTAFKWEASSQAMIHISRYASTHPVSELYDDNNRYRADLMQEAWNQAVAELLQHPENYRSSGGMQLELRWHDGAWRIVPNEKLLQMLTGGVKLTEKEEQP